MNRIKCCIKKDFKEYFRTGKIFASIVLCSSIFFLILVSTLVFSNIPDILNQELKGLDIKNLEELMINLYPKKVLESIGIFAYYIGFFYSMIMIVVVHSILPNERKNGRWILPNEQGYKKMDFVISKCFVYGIMSFASVFVFYMLYFFAANIFMEKNMYFSDAFILAFVHGINLFMIIVYTLLMSVWYKSGLFAAISMIGTVLLVPDIMTYFDFGKYFPTYMLTFVYESQLEYSDLLISFLINIILIVICYFISKWKLNKTTGV